MNRRQLLKLLASGVVGSALDVDQLLWIPNQKKIFLPTIHRLTTSQVIAIELERILPKISSLFDRDDTFYATIVKGTSELNSKRVGRNVGNS